MRLCATRDQRRVLALITAAIVARALEGRMKRPTRQNFRPSGEPGHQTAAYGLLGSPEAPPEQAVLLGKQSSTRKTAERLNPGAE